jgi:inhibitor of cysteine peptidase
LARKLFLLSILALVMAALAACQTATEPTEEPVGMPNPASVFCEENNGALETRIDADGNQYGVCMFEDGTECEEWAYFRGECQPGQYDVAPVPTAEP